MIENFVGFIDQKVKEEYEKAKEENPQLFKFLERATNDLKENPFCGIKIPKNLWPHEYVKKYSIEIISGNTTSPMLGGLYTLYQRTRSRF